MDVAATPTSLFAPFRRQAFLVIWTATLVSNIGSWMYSSASAWLMTGLAPDPTTVSLVQVASTLPMFLFAIPAGALADLVDRRLYLIACESLVTLISAVFAFMVYLRAINSTNLLFFTFLVEAGSALTAPVWQSIVPALVEKKELPPAIALNSIGINISRAIGPALGGIATAAVSIAFPFWINAISNLATIGALIWWKEPKPTGVALPKEPYAEALRVGMRHALHNSALKRTLVLACCFFLLASSYWALLPLVAASVGGGTLYGILLGLIGVGAIFGAVVLRPLAAKVRPNTLISFGSVGSGLACLLFGTTTNVILLGAASLMAGACWITVLTNLNVSAQLSLPNWVRGRGIAIYVTAMFGSLTLGSYCWGHVAHATGLATALLIAGALLVMSVGLQLRWPLMATTRDLEPSMHWPMPKVEADTVGAGPVLVTVEYRINEANREDFLKAITEIAGERSRDGAYEWSLFEDAETPGRFIESFRLESWSEHMLQHARVTRADRAQQEIVSRYLRSPSVVTHWITPS